MKMRPVLVDVGFAFACSFLFAGCGESGPALVSVTGTVVQDGKPLEGAAVMFLPDGSSKDARPAEDTTGPEGTYKLLTGGRFGAVPGKYRVTVTKAPTVPAGAASEAFKDDPFMANLSAGQPSKKGGGGSEAVEFTTEREITQENPQVQDIDVKVKAADADAKAKAK